MMQYWLSVAQLLDKGSKASMGLPAEKSTYARLGSVINSYSTVFQTWRKSTLRLKTLFSLKLQYFSFGLDEFLIHVWKTVYTSHFLILTKIQA